MTSSIPRPRTLLTLEDYTPGRADATDWVEVSAADIVAFAGAFDPQPFHLGQEHAEGTFFGELVASGWHTAALTMRLLASHHTVPAWGVVGRGVDSLSWSRPVRPGDRLRVESVVEAVTPSASKPWLGTVRLRCATVDAQGGTVQTMVPHLVVPTRDGLSRFRTVG